VLQQVNFKEIESVELHRHKAKRKSLWN
jgi:hypothetical protein